MVSNLRLWVLSTIQCYATSSLLAVDVKACSDLISAQNTLMSMVWLAVCEAVGEALSKVPMNLCGKIGVQKNCSSVKDVAITILALLEDY